ncbi:uncharacterized protein MONOS_6165 [Monocercomonoides exilis]|uniref:uncharacterized protein n=1 Tax=Monocercomonoides exilis TaxID=2049356 RepID=UPI0035595741|nr:hypothetical protein MONOS_6165 [Monocercomonoides exilis]|eukprot:MONOS_6165.1-p1 / transcript=MONOS_6165.1 / gene=MONOS_6165 / organism=Monocercomonoides_exilis_PA203 / gene_product=unspecified product / transcript_product=unspecified product / location=Mono_scaffold00190:86269-87308(-) / protein_length=328 / sequence_SO=supercontig / SO=protein_coding / is_pseudo=false
MIIDEKEKKEGKNEKLLVDLCECLFLLAGMFSSELFSICVPCLLKFALKKDEEEEIIKEVEVALLALSNIVFGEGTKELYLNEIKEIILHHQEHQNLTRLAYQSAWDFLIFRLDNDESLNEVIANELHFGRESTKELEVLTRNVDWKKKEEEMSKEEANEVLLITGWMKTIKSYFDSCKLWNEEYVELIGSVVQIYRTAKDNYEEIRYWCVFSLRNAAGNGFVPVDELLKSGAVDCVLEDIRKPRLNHEITYHSLTFFENISRRLKREKLEKMEEAKRKELKRKVLEKIEEEGYEDIITSFHGTFCLLSRKHYPLLSLDVSVYFVNV